MPGIVAIGPMLAGTLWAQKHFTLFVSGVAKSLANRSELMFTSSRRIS